MTKYFSLRVGPGRFPGNCGAHSGQLPNSLTEVSWLFGRGFHGNSGAVLAVPWQLPGDSRAVPQASPRQFDVLVYVRWQIPRRTRAATEQFPVPGQVSGTSQQFLATFRMVTKQFLGQLPGYFPIVAWQFRAVPG